MSHPCRGLSRDDSDFAIRRRSAGLGSLPHEKAPGFGKWNRPRVSRAANPREGSGDNLFMSLHAPELRSPAPPDKGLPGFRERNLILSLVGNPGPVQLVQSAPQGGDHHESSFQRPEQCPQHERHH